MYIDIYMDKYILKHALIHVHVHTHIHMHMLLYCREAAMQAKLQSTAERIQKVAGLKDKWAKEKERKMQSHRDKRAEGKYTIII